MAAPIYKYEARIIKGGQDLQIAGAGTPNLVATYGDYVQGGGVKVADCRLPISYSNISYTLNNDNSVTVNGKITGAVLTRTSTGNPDQGVRFRFQAWFNNVKTYENTVGAGSSGTYDLNIPGSFSVTVQPRSSVSLAAIHFYNQSPESPQYDPDEFTLGLYIENPNYPDYRPGAILGSDGKWLSHNRSSGKAHILGANGKWKEMRTSIGHSSNGNPPSIRVNDKWANQRKIGKE